MSCNKITLPVSVKSENKICNSLSLHQLTLDPSLPSVYRYTNWQTGITREGRKFFAYQSIQGFELQNSELTPKQGPSLVREGFGISCNKILTSVSRTQFFTR